MYTFEQYREMVKKSFLDDCDERQLDEAKKYFNSEEAQRVIRVNYKEDIAKLKNKQITDKIFCNGCVNGVAYCLSMMM